MCKILGWERKEKRGKWRGTGREGRGGEGRGGEKEKEGRLAGTSEFYKTSHMIIFLFVERGFEKPTI